ncbi:hypothetical protein DPEC_G00170060 [Dallia pectoralis]|uniref:Uncharacterized protein n=1 Tax=Dallia pectoralis TaxID=75939 RepID=A0ACC2GDB0_DALPE|nr:hypothetical protein DPEC_G00170060 [Dallia pectoralis]
MTTLATSSAVPVKEGSEDYIRRTLGDEVWMKLQSQHVEIARATKMDFVNQVMTNEVEERERYRYQWRREDRQRIVSDRLELGVAIVTGGLMGLVSGVLMSDVIVGGVIMGGVTGFVIWFTTGLVRNGWSP